MQTNPAEFEQYADRVKRELIPPEEWEQPIPFDNENGLPAFPADALPEPVARYADALSVSTQTAPAMAGAVGLGVLSALFQKDYTLQVNSEWSETLSLYMLVVAQPASRKSSVFDKMMRPVRDMEQHIQAAQRADIARSEAEISLLKDSITAARKAAAQGDGEQRERMLELSEQLAGAEEKFPYKMITGDATSEALALEMYQQGGSITVASAEGGGLFDLAAGKYSNQPDISLYLSGHDGDFYDCSRITRKGFSIRSPRLCMILTIQPQVLESAMQNPVFTGRGLVARLLPVFCPQKFGERSQNPPPVPDYVKAEYNRFISAAFEAGGGIIRLSEAAEMMRRVYSHEIDCRLDDEWSGDFSAWAGKLCGTALRIAALLHIGDAVAAGADPTASPISAECFSRAVQIAGCLTAHAEHAYRTGGIDSQAGARFLWNAIQRTAAGEISKRDLYRAARSTRYQRVSDMDADLEQLEELGYIRVEAVLREGRGRKPSPVIRVNPGAAKK